MCRRLFAFVAFLSESIIKNLSAYVLKLAGKFKSGVILLQLL